MHILNRDSRCASWITIQTTVFWTVCTPNHVEIHDLRCVTRKHLWTVIWDAHLKSRISTWFGVHMVQNTVFRIVIQDAHLESRFKIRTLPSCENSLSLSRITNLWFMCEVKCFSCIYDTFANVQIIKKKKHTHTLVVCQCTQILGHFFPGTKSNELFHWPALIEPFHMESFIPKRVISILVNLRFKLLKCKENNKKICITFDHNFKNIPL